MKPNFKKLVLIGVFSIGIAIPAFAFSCFGSNAELFQARAEEQFLMTLSESSELVGN